MQSVDLGDRRSWRKRLKHVVSLHLRQVPCLHGVLRNVPKCCTRRSYQTLGQDEEGDGSEAVDKRQNVSKTFGQVMMRISMLCMLAITALCIMRPSKLKGGETAEYW
ncbi:unnamed protein product, partial [Polarella glacialis]